ncbi:redox-regulated ATPase YchF [archaeon]|jgi:ribosome-binding ATPase|nr:redox-regulated ATPase YchF [archaeon]MBT4242016.1 redox-regulated ATPase YchF [archaeon]MBT4418563.1 redox-regulated ATPase YchF [archaeon]
MLIGLVGKPSSGKSTFFKAATLADVLIAAYPFATIKPNQGVGYVRVECIDKEFNAQCNPSKGYCVKGTRFVPIDLLDVAGLVEGASEGKGLGNQFLDNLTSADAFIHIVDVSGETDAEGKETKGYNPVKDIDMLENELDLWYLGILKKVWKTFSKSIQNTKGEFAKSVAIQFSGLKVSEDDIREVILKDKFDIEKPSEWDDDELKRFSHELRHLTKPMIIAANKIDKETSKENLEKLKEAYPELMIVPCSADSELALREANKAGLIDYLPGSKSFKIKGDINEKQKSALENIQKNVLEVYGSTGVQDILDKVIFDLLKYIGVFPASANKLADSKGNILPDCFLIKDGSTALDFAFAIHSDLGNNFIRAINARTKQAVGKEHKLKHRDGLEIIT